MNKFRRAAAVAVALSFVASLSLSPAGAGDIRSIGEELDKNTVSAGNSGAAATEAVSASDGVKADAAQASGVKGAGEKRAGGGKAVKFSGGKSIFGKIFGFLDGLIGKTIGFFKKVCSGLGFCRNGEKQALPGETIADNDAAPVARTAAPSAQAAPGASEGVAPEGWTPESELTPVESENASTPSSSSPGASGVTGRVTGSAPASPGSGVSVATGRVADTAPAVESPASEPAPSNDGPVASENTVAPADMGTRPAGSETGSTFMGRVTNKSLIDYDKAVQEEILKGNIPDFLKNFKEVKVNFKTKDGKEHTASYFVMPDYLAVGTDSDFARVPMTPMAAQKIAEKYGCVLPTKKMVDDIYSQATVKLNPQPISVDKGISKISNFDLHNKMVETQRAGKPLGALTAGNQKDVVITNLLDQAAAQGKKQVAIYGWHQKNGKPIQPLSTIHNYYHVDYSHGVRLVKDTMIVDGKEMKMTDVLKDPELSRALSYEGPIRNAKAHR